jgi:hypothetical protein
MYIGISGRIGVGKTTVARMLLARFPHYRRKGFGDFLKEEVAKRFNFPLEYCYERKNEVVLHPDLPNGAMSVRRILQWWGDKRRQENKLYLVNKMRQFLDKHDKVIIDDIRFPEEAGLIRNYGGVLIRIHPYPGYKYTEQSYHISETALDDYHGWDMEFKPDFGREFLRYVANNIEKYLF